MNNRAGQARQTPGQRTNRRDTLVTSCLLPFCLAVQLATLPLAAWAQSADIASEQKTADDSDDSSQHVEESDEAFRRRMETAESHDQADVMRPRSSGTGKAPVGIDALPADSRKHLRDQLRNVIIEQGEWQPEDAGTVYPYVPSVTAEQDPELRQQEEKAWGELVQEYHKREAAALAMGGGRSGSQPSDEQRQPGAPGEAGPAGAKSAADPSERPATQAAGSTAAGAGVSQSALEFLRKQQAGANTAPAPAGAAGGAAASAKASAAGGQPQSSSGQQSQNTVAQEASNQAAGEEQKKAADAEPPPPPGSVAIAELVALEEKARREAAEQAARPSEQTQQAAESASGSPGEEERTNSVTLQSSDQPPPVPGTIAIPELEKLQGMEEAPPLAVREPASENPDSGN